DLVPIQHQIGQIAPELGLQQAILQRELETRTLPDIGSQFASQGAFSSGARIRAQGRAREDTATAKEMAQVQASSRIRDLLVSMGLIPFGRSL
ncbi:MAG: hypothetical protein ACRDGA_11270, partial [Bacteroidota bacterium]